MSALGAAVSHLCTARESGRSDESLLEAFAGARDDDAFAALVRRHGPLVRGVCRRLLRDPDEADDTFQATFLVLAKKAGSIRKQQSVGSWLYGVAYRLALKARARLARRPRAAEPSDVPAPADGTTDLAWRELRGLLDEELHRLPEELRAPLLLCYLEGRPQDEATRHLSWPLGTFRRRLDRGRELLRARLARRDCSLSAVLLPLALAPGEAAAVPAALLSATTRAAASFASGAASPALSVTAVTSARGALNAMMLAKLKLAAAVVVALGVASGAAVSLSYQGGAAGAATPAPEAAPDPALGRAWSDLASADPAAAMRALRVLVEAPADAVPLLGDRLKGVLAEATPRRIADLIEALDSPKFAERERAGRELEAVLEEAAPHLQKVLNGKPPLELKRRVEVLLSRRRAEDTLGAHRRQVLRGFALLECVGSPEARAALERAARDGKEAWVAEAAAAALKRLAAKQPPADQPWDDLISDDAGVAARAFLALATLPDEEKAPAEQVRAAVRLADDVPPVPLRSRGVTSRRLPYDLLPYRKQALVGYGDDGKDSAFRRAVRDGVKALKRSETDLPVQEEFTALPEPQLTQYKRQLEIIQKDKVGEAYFQIGKATEELEELKDARAAESKGWQAHYDYVLAHLYARQASILEYSAMLGRIRKDDLPPLDPQRHDGWRLAAKGMMTDKDGRDAARQARKLLDRLGAEHKGTPWEIIARQEAATPFGLEWVPRAK